MNATFQAGRTYLGRFACDSAARIELTVASRTAKTINAARRIRDLFLEAHKAELASVAREILRRENGEPA